MLEAPRTKFSRRLRPEPGDIIINKSTIGAFASSSIDSILRSMGRNQLIMCGISTNMCVETTAREAADRGYSVTLVEDACATTHADLHASTMKNFARLFGRVQPCDEVLSEIGALSKK
ncbi:cysteine hydrolase family protein [Pseudoroseomonas wenyumeiae]